MAGKGHTSARVGLQIGHGSVQQQQRRLQCCLAAVACPALTELLSKQLQQLQPSVLLLLLLQGWVQ
jgi:hypothetical protein